MLYRLTKGPARLLLGTYFRRLFLSHTHRIPRGEAVILAANHPTAYMEPCILACWLPQPLHFIVRGDIFRKGFYARILRAYHMIPVYRLKDGGYGKLRNNYQAFEKAYEVLQARKTLMILAEGSTKHEKRLRPLKKGTARLALGALEQTELREVYIVPVGVNFTNSNRSRSEAMINFGEPIRASEFREEYQENNNRGILSLTRHLRDRLAEDVLIVEDPVRDEVAECYFAMYRNDHPLQDFRGLHRDETRLRHHQVIANWINGLSDADFAELAAQVTAYRTRLAERGLSDRAVSKQYRRATGGIGWPLLLLLPAALGYLLHWPYIALARDVVRRRVRHPEFKASVYITILLGLYPVWWGLIIGWCSLGGAAAAGLLLPVLGYIYVIFRDRWQEYAARAKWQKKGDDSLLQQRAELLARCDPAVNDCW